MNKLSKAAPFVVALLIFTVALGLLTSRPVPAQAPPPSLPVRVVNTPLPVQGTVNANVTNASIPVTGTVTASIAGTPNVNATVANTVAVTGAVAVSSLPNNATSPIYVRDVDNPAREPFSASLCADGGVPDPIQTCGTFFSSTLTVPNVTADGKTVIQLVIDYVSGVCNAYQGADPTSITITIPAGVTSNYLVPIKTYGPNSFHLDALVFAQETRLYVAAGTTIQFGDSYETDAGSFGNPVSNHCFANVVGHFVTQ